MRRKPLPDMIIATHIPRAPLNDLVEVLWFHEGVNCDHRLERVLPDGSMELIINLHEETRHVFDGATYQPRESYCGSWLSGPHSQPIIIDTAPDASMIGAHFKPGAASAFFNLPLSEVRNRVVGLDSFWNGAAQSLREQLLEATRPAAKFRVLENALLARWAGRQSSHRAVRHALDRFALAPEHVTVGEVTAEIGLSARRFIEVFTEQVGMTPKLFCRVRRFQRALAEIQQAREVVWTEIAMGCGYFDQAHFIHDFKEFCGLKPGDYLAAHTAEPNFIAIRA